VSEVMDKTRRNPWYILGTEFSTRMSIDDALEAVNGDDEVQPATLYTIESMTPITVDQTEGVFIPAYDLEEVQGSIGIKSDIYGTMSTAGPNYEIMQRREALEIAYEISGLCGDEAMVKSIGHLGPRAQKFFAYIELPTLIIDPGGICDEILRGLYVATSFDGSMSTTIGASDLRIACTNMLAMALRKLDRPIRVHHKVNAEARIRQAAEVLGYAGAVEQAKMRKAEEMLKVDGSKALRVVLDEFYPVDDPDLPSSTLAKRTTARGNIRHLYEDEHGTAGAQVGKNGYGVYQAFTEYMDWYKPVRVSKSEGVTEHTRRAANAVMPGVVVNAKMRASDVISALAA